MPTILLRQEDLRSGDGLTELQREWQREYLREGTREVYAGIKKRRLLTLAATTSYGCPMLGAYLGNPPNPIMPASEVLIWALYDRPRSTQSNGSARKVETAAVCMSGYLDDDLSARVGGDPTSIRRVLDFSVMPVTPAQQGARKYADTQVGPVQLRSPRDGEFRIRRLRYQCQDSRSHEDKVDLCIGVINAGGRVNGQIPRVLCRLDHGDLVGSDPKVEINVDSLELPAGGAFREYGFAKKGSLLATFTQRTSYLEELRSTDGLPVMQAMPGWLLSSLQRHTFGILNTIQSKLNDLTFKPAGEREALVDPAYWSWRPRILLPADLAASITRLKGFQLSEKLKADILRAVSPDDTWCLTSKHDGVVEKICALSGEPHLLQIRFAGGRTQTVPMSAQLLKSSCKVQSSDPSGSILATNFLGPCRSLEPGDYLYKGERIGFYCPRLHYSSWEQLQQQVGHNLLWLVECFLQETAIRPGYPGWDGPGVLFDLEYVKSVSEAAVRDVATGKPRLFWDFSSTLPHATCYRGALIMPPIRYEDGTASELFLPGVQISLSAPGLAAPASTRRYYQKAPRDSSTVKREPQTVATG